MVFWVSARISRTDFPDRSACGTFATLSNVSFCLQNLSQFCLQNLSQCKLISEFRLPLHVDHSL